MDTINKTEVVVTTQVEVEIMVEEVAEVVTITTKVKEEMDSKRILRDLIDNQVPSIP